MVRPPVEEEEDEELMFMTHMPGATVAPRASTAANDDLKAFEEKLALKKFEERLAADKEKKEAAKSGKAGGTAGGTARASRPAGPERGTPLDEIHVREAPKPVVRTGAAAQLGHRLVEGAFRLGEGAGADALKRTLAAARADGSTTSRGPRFLALVPGALATPLRPRTLPTTLGLALLVGVALLVLEVSALAGALALAVVAVEWIGLRVKQVRETASGRDDARWPGVGEALGAVPTWLAAVVVLAPAAFVGWLASGAAASPQGGLGARAGAAWVAVADAPAEGAWLGQRLLLGAEALIGPRPDAGPAPATRAPTRLAADVALAARERAGALLRPAEGDRKGLLARALLLLALPAFPLALLAAGKLRAAYAAWYPPLVLRVLLRWPVEVAVVVVAWVLQVAVGAGALLVLPASLHARLDPVPAHLLTAAAAGLALSAPALVTGALIGRLYRSHAHQLGWE